MFNSKTICLASLAAFSLFIGFLEHGPMHAYPYANVLTVSHALISIGLVFLWFWFDKTERGYVSSLLLNIAIIGLTIFAFPYYLFKSRGVLGGLKAFGLSVLVFIGTMTAYRVGVWLG